MIPAVIIQEKEIERAGVRNFQEWHRAYRDECDPLTIPPNVRFQHTPDWRVANWLSVQSAGQGRGPLWGTVRLAFLCGAASFWGVVLARGW